MKTVRFLVRYCGHVQNVGFRMTAVAQARGLQVHGYVRNEPNGSVLMDVEGPEQDVEELMRRIEAAMSDNIEDTITDACDPSGANGGFTIRY